MQVLTLGLSEEVQEVTEREKRGREERQRRGGEKRGIEELCLREVPMAPVKLQNQLYCPVVKGVCKVSLDQVSIRLVLLMDLVQTGS